MENVLYLTNIKHFPCWYTVLSTRVGIGKTRNCVETQRPKSGVFSAQFRVFLISTSVDTTIYQCGKMFYIFL
jgi:hypothetical protein